jgi:hypothetical protein
MTGFPSKKSRISCPCGENVTPNTLATHLRSPNCLLPRKSREPHLKILNMRREHPRAWLKADGSEAVHQKDWFLSVIQGNSSLEDWVFVSPRAYGQVRKSTAARMSKIRTGAGNPSMKDRPQYNREDVLSLISDLWSKWEMDLDLFKGAPDFWKSVEESFPSWKWTFPGTKRLSVISLAAGIQESDVKKLLSLSRGRKISRGQRNSPRFMEMAKEAGANLMSRWRVTLPQRRLFSLFLLYDPDASLEMKMRAPWGQCSFDIFSPKINCVVEMHGRVWHDSSASTPGIVEVAKKNEANDLRKKTLATDMGYRYLVFWSDQEESWEQEVKSLFT